MWSLLKSRFTWGYFCLLIVFIGNGFNLTFYLIISPSLCKLSVAIPSDFQTRLFWLILNLNLKLLNFAKFTEVSVSVSLLHVYEHRSKCSSLRKVIGTSSFFCLFFFFPPLVTFKKLTASAYLPLHICWWFIISSNLSGSVRIWFL